MQRKKTTKKKEVNYEKVDFKGSNKNIFSARLYPAATSKKKSDYERHFIIIDINGVSISASLMINTEDISKTFIAWPSYYNENKDEYQTQVFISNEGLKEDLDDFIDLCLDKLGFVEDPPFIDED